MTFSIIPHQTSPPKNLGETFPPRKKCYQCGVTYPRDISHFYPNADTRDQLSWLCIICFDRKIIAKSKSSPWGE